MNRDQIIVSGLPSISEQVRHTQRGQQYVRRNDRTLWRVTGIYDNDIVHIHTVNGWERLIQEQLPIEDFERDFEEYNKEAK